MPTQKRQARHGRFRPGTKKKTIPDGYPAIKSNQIYNKGLGYPESKCILCYSILVRFREAHGFGLAEAWVDHASFRQFHKRTFRVGSPDPISSCFGIFPLLFKSTTKGSMKVNRCPSIYNMLFLHTAEIMHFV